jgi:DNA-3-methyladenine glycosylase II
VHWRNLDVLKSDPVMAAWIGCVGAMTLEPKRLDPFQYLVQAIVYQQLTGKAAATIHRRLLARLGGGLTPGAILGTPPEVFREVGLSRPKTKYIVGLAGMAAEGRIPTLAECDRLTDAQISDKLLAIKGVGQWTVEMFLIFNLGRPDVLPVDDLGIRKGFRLVYHRRLLPNPNQLARFGRRWAPQRTAAAWYLWRAADTGARTRPPPAAAGSS